MLCAIWRHLPFRADTVAGLPARPGLPCSLAIHLPAHPHPPALSRTHQVSDSLTDMAFLNCRPSVIAAALLYVERRSRGIIPFWPSMLAKLTGYQVRGWAAVHMVCSVQAGGQPAG